MQQIQGRCIDEQLAGCGEFWRTIAARGTNQENRGTNPPLNQFLFSLETLDSPSQSMRNVIEGSIVLARLAGR